MNILLRRRGSGLEACNAIALAATVPLQVVRADRWIPNNTGPTDYIFRWGCTTPVEARGATIVNETRALNLTSDKKASRLAMQQAGISVPKTWASEEAFGEGVYPWGYPANYTGDTRYIARPRQHSQGQNLVHGCPATVAGALLDHWKDGYISELIAKVAEYRVFVCQGKCVWVARKTPGNPDDVAWNVAQGGHFDNVRWGDWPIACVKEAILANEVLGTDFNAIDVMVDAEGKAYVLEGNTCPAVESTYRQACTARAFSYIVGNGKANIPTEQFRTWRDVVHPSLLNN